MMWQHMLHTTLDDPSAMMSLLQQLVRWVKSVSQSEQKHILFRHWQKRISEGIWTQPKSSSSYLAEVPRSTNKSQTTWCVLIAHHVTAENTGPLPEMKHREGEKATLSLQIIYGTQFTLRHFHLFLSWMKNTFAVGWRWSLQRGFAFIDADFFWWKRTNRSGPLAVIHSVIQPHTVFAYETGYCRMQGDHCILSVSIVFHTNWLIKLWFYWNFLI